MPPLLARKMVVSKPAGPASDPKIFPVQAGIISHIGLRNSDRQLPEITNTAYQLQ